MVTGAGDAMEGITAGADVPDGLPQKEAAVTHTQFDGAAGRSVGEADEGSAGPSAAALWAALMAAAVLAAVWLREGQPAAHFYQIYYRLAAGCLGISICCVAAAGGAALLRRRRLHRTPDPGPEAALRPTSSPPE